MTYSDSNTHIFKNAAKLVAAKQRLAEETRNEVTDLSQTAPAEEAGATSLEDVEASISATTPVGKASASKSVEKAGASQQKKKKGGTSKKKGGTSQQKKKKKAKPSSSSALSSAPPPATIAETKTADTTPDVSGESAEAIVLTEVKSKFANVASS